MDRTFDHNQKILVAVEFADAPRQIIDPPPGYAVFQRIAIPEVERAFAEKNLFVRLIAGRKFHNVLDQHMSYWEKRVPVGKQCYVHYAIGQTEVIANAAQRLSQLGGWVMLGCFRTEPQSSSYPFAFPTEPAPNHWHLDETHTYTKDSIFWFNFFPAQPYLFEKTFAVWVLFQMFQGHEGGECNQLVARDDAAPYTANGVDDFVQVNLNRFTNLPGFFNAAGEAGRYTFTQDPHYTWYGMLLRKLDSPAHKAS